MCLCKIKYCCILIKKLVTGFFCLYFLYSSKQCKIFKTISQIYFTQQGKSTNFWITPRTMYMPFSFQLRVPPSRLLYLKANLLMQNFTTKVLPKLNTYFWKWRLTTGLANVRLLHDNVSSQKMSVVQFYWILKIRSVKHLRSEMFQCLNIVYLKYYENTFKDWIRILKLWI
jgi:hypothetical protein